MSHSVARRQRNAPPLPVVTTDSGLTISLTGLCTVPVSLGVMTSMNLDPADFQTLIAKGVYAPVAERSARGVLLRAWMGFGYGNGVGFVVERVGFHVES